MKAMAATLRVDGIDGFIEAPVKDDATVSLGYVISKVYAPSVTDSVLHNIVGTKRVDRGSALIKEAIIWYLQV